MATAESRVQPAAQPPALLQSAPQSAPDSPPRSRLRIEVGGAVQGVGFRPTVYRVATALGLAGWVSNTAQGVVIEIEGPDASVAGFADRLRAEMPPLAVVRSLQIQSAPVQGEAAFCIRSSDVRGDRRTLLLPDVATCPACLAEIRAAQDRRAGYPFTNCTHCGPRFSIIEGLPYDRPRTTMRGFALCPDCRREYKEPADRRFHAQPTACPHCGPRLTLYERQGAAWLPSAEKGDALQRAAAALRSGRIAAVKGLGGFHLMADAGDAQAVRTLRERKGREEKPLALMVADLEQARTLVELDDDAAALLASPAAPIVLLPRRADAPVAAAVAPSSTTLGIMLPYTPLHHLLMAEMGRPLVATSGNRSDEPICTRNEQAFATLGSIADLFLVHDRPIARHVDDSVLRISGGAPRFLRRARGYAPLPVPLSRSGPPLLAVGGHLKNTIALTVGADCFLSQHIGDLETPEAFAAFERVIADFVRLYESPPALIAHDLHPDYASSQWARRVAAEGGAGIEAGLPRITVQHHHAHLAACLADNGLDGDLQTPALGVVWDGSGYGSDGTVWGGEFLSGTAADFARTAHLRTFRLPGGEAAVREPRRAALALLWELDGAQALEDATLPPVADFTPAERTLVARMLDAGLNAPLTSSAGRLFDGIAALMGLRQRAGFEGQAAMLLEAAVDWDERGAYPLALRQGDAALLLDWEPLLRALLADCARGVATGIMAARVHRGLAQGIAAVAQRVGLSRVALTGGCFQNRVLSEWTASELRTMGFEVLQHRQVPANDGGLSLGQAAVAAARAV